MRRFFNGALKKNNNKNKWYGLIDSGSVRIARKAIVPLLAEIRPDAIPLVDSFDYPDFVLHSAIGVKDGNVYEVFLFFFMLLNLFPKKQTTNRILFQIKINKIIKIKKKVSV